MAAPHVSGAAALLLSGNANLSASEIKQILLNRADDITIESHAAKRLDIGSALWSIISPDYLDIQNAGKPNGNWNIKVTNHRSAKMRVIYNSKMCFEGDAKNWTDLSDIKYFDLSAGASKDVEVSGNGTAGHISFSIVIGSTRYITYANGLYTSAISTNGKISPYITTCNYQNNTNINLVGKNGNTWIIDVKNNFGQQRRVDYNRKMCFQGDAKDWKGLNDISQFPLNDQAVDTIEISENGTAGYIAISFVNESTAKRDVRYANNLNKNCELSVYTNQIDEAPPADNCVAEGTLITLADGSQQAVETLTGDEMLLVWNLYTGTFDAAPILFIDSDVASLYEIINLSFSDGTHVEIIYEHAFWDIDLNRYVFLRNDAAQFIGHRFNKQTINANGELTWVSVQLIDVEIYEQYTTAWSPVTAGHLCYYVNGMLSMPGATEGLINYFEVDAQTMQYDQAMLEADLALYGEFSYEDFADLIPEEIFEAVGVKYLTVSLGKDLITWEQIETLIARYVEFFA